VSRRPQALLAGARQPGVRLAAEVRHQTILIARDPGPMIGYLVMGLLLITATRPLYVALDRLTQAPAAAGTDQAAAGMSVMFSLFALKVGAAHLLNERTWHTWDRLLASPARFGEILAGKALPIFVAILAQQAVLFGFTAVALAGSPAQLGRPLAVLGAFALAGAGSAALISARAARPGHPLPSRAALSWGRFRGTQGIRGRLRKRTSDSGRYAGHRLGRPVRR
jgi:ABC-2 type transport system permease protein